MHDHVMPRRVLLVFLALVALCPALAMGEAQQASTPVTSAFCHTECPIPDVPECERVDDSYFSSAVLVGDSLADGIAIHGVVPELQLLSRIGLSPHTALTNDTFKNNGKPVTLEKKLPVMRPSAVYLWLGSNGLVGQEADKVIHDYDRLLNRLLTALPETPFYLLEVTPVEILEGEQYKNFTNERIDDFNAQLREVAERHNVYLLPVNDMLKDAEGNLAKGYGAEDGIHLRLPAYEALADYLYTHALPEMPEPEPTEAPTESPEPEVTP